MAGILRPVLSLFFASTLSEALKACESLYGEARQRKINRLQNIIIITFIALHAVQLIATAALGVYLLAWDFGNFYWSLLWYAVPPVLAVVMDTYLLQRKMQNQWGIAWDVILQGWFLAGVMTVSLFMGFKSGFWLFILPALFNPFMIYQGQLSLRLAYFFANALGLAGAIFLGLNLPALLPLPEKITTIVLWLISGIFAISAVVFVAVGWWRLSLTARFLSLWRKWSMRGAHLFPDTNPRKYRIIQNQLMLLFCVIVAMMEAIVVGLTIKYHFLSLDTLSFITHYFFPTAAMILVLGICIFANNYFRTIVPVAVALVTGLIFIAYMGISIDRKSLFYLVSLSLLPMPFIALPHKLFLDKVLTGLVAVGIAIQVLATHWYLKGHNVLQPLPNSNDVDFVNYVIITALILIFFFAFFYTSRESRNTEDVLEIERHNLALERKKSDDLLLNILPADVAQELKESGRTRPILFQSATVFFTDFVGFTQIAESMKPEELVEELDRCFSYFDTVCSRYKLEKLKTIGDAFMAAAGLPIPNNTHAIDCCLAALEIQAFMKQIKEIKEDKGLPYWELRLGISTGNLVAGVVGKKKFAYDVWGDTVNTASRMESSGVPGMINISEATYQQVRFLFDCKARGKVKAKNKGEIAMYFLRGIKKKYAADDEGRIPNEDFLALYDKIAGGAKLVPRVMVPQYSVDNL